MRYVSVEYPDGKRSWGLLNRDHFVDVPAAAVRAGRTVAPDLIGFVCAGRAQWNWLIDALPDLALMPDSTPSQWRLLAPIPQPRRNVFAVGRNYADHAAEAGADDIPNVPIIFSKAVDECGRPDGVVAADPTLTRKLDWEVELAVVIGVGGRRIPEETAMDHVFGYTVVNDISARDVQEERVGGQWLLGKSFVGACPMGPHLVTPDELDHSNVELSLRVNDVEKQRSTTNNMIFTVPRLIAELSRYLVLLPGDIIATGTPSGVGAASEPPEFLCPGDVMDAMATGIGTLRTTVTYC